MTLLAITMLVGGLLVWLYHRRVPNEPFYGLMLAIVLDAAFVLVLLWLIRWMAWAGTQT